MITGVVNANSQAVVCLAVCGLTGHQQEIEAVIDTGFTGFLTLPPLLIASLGLEWRGREQAILGDGSVRVFDVFVATVLWDGKRRMVEVDAAEIIPLIGMGLIYGHDLRIQTIEGGKVTIEALPFPAPKA